MKGTPLAAVTVRRNPYKGLRAFAEADARDFCGRNALTDELVTVVERSTFVMVVGPSGSGKSSLVQAGLVPRLRATGSRVATMTPGEHPAANLRTALLAVAVRPPPIGAPITAVTAVAGEASSQLVLVVDQMEEAWTLAVDDDEREQFLSMLAAPPATSAWWPRFAPISSIDHSVIRCSDRSSPRVPSA